MCVSGLGMRRCTGVEERRGGRLKPDESRERLCGHFCVMCVCVCVCVHGTEGVGYREIRAQATVGYREIRAQADCSREATEGRECECVSVCECV